MLVSSRASVRVPEHQNERRLDAGRRSASGLKSGSGMGVKQGCFGDSQDTGLAGTDLDGLACGWCAGRMERETKHTGVGIVRGVMLVRAIPMDVNGIRLTGVGDGTDRREGQLRGERQQGQRHRAEGFPF
jgi:hypothetical protein